MASRAARNGRREKDALVIITIHTYIMTFIIHLLGRYNMPNKVFLLELQCYYAN